MCDCEGFSDFSDDQNRPGMTTYQSKLKKLNFTNYESLDTPKKLEDAIFLIDFDKDRLSVGKQNDKIYHIFYDGKPLRVATKAFSGIIKRSKVFAREKKIKAKDSMVSEQLWHVINRIIQLVRIEELKSKKLCDFLEPYCVYFDPDERVVLTIFEDCVIAFDQVVKTEEGKNIKEFRIIGQVVESRIAIPS